MYTLQCNNLEPIHRSFHVKISLHLVCVVLVKWIDIDGDLALFNPTKPFLRGEFGQDQREDSKEKPRTIAKPTVPVPSLS